MRQSQKIECKFDHFNAHICEQMMVRSAASGENTSENGISFKQLVLDRHNLNEAYERVYRNKGGAGIDGMTVYDLFDYIEKNKDTLLDSLSNSTYKPSPVKRVEIPKPNGTMRKLGIPTVVDRLIQQAVAQVMSPIYEKVFSNNSFGFRPNRSAHDAVKRVMSIYKQGYHVVIDLDLKSYFDTVNHDLLIKFIKQYTDDEWLLKLIRKFLTSGVMNEKLFQETEKGTPQGGNLSPLLANIYLNELDKLLAERGHKFVRYADDCNIYVKSKRAGRRVLNNISRFLENDLKLTINQEKTKITRPTKSKFLGFSLGFTSKGLCLRPCSQSKKRIKQSLRLITKRSRGRKLDVILKEIKQEMVGWLNYYGIGAMKYFIKSLDAWLRARVRQYIWKSWKKPKTRYKKLIKLGVTRHQAYICANSSKGYWHTVHGDILQHALTKKKLESFGLINMTKRLQLIQNA